jgi:hypothetical protein
MNNPPISERAETYEQKSAMPTYADVPELWDSGPEGQR